MSDDEIVDVVFALEGERIAADYADRLLAQLLSHLPWLDDEPHAGVHPLAGVSPSGPVVYLGHRARLSLRLPAVRAQAGRALTGRRLDLGGTVMVGEARVRALMPAHTLYSSFVTFGTMDETAFLAACAEQLADAGVKGELICGKPHHGAGEAREWHGFSLMLHGLSPDDSLRIQRRGMGLERKRGCGILIPHKSVAAVG